MGGRLLYFGIIKPISLLPFFILYRISDGLYYLLYYIIRYRRDVVRDNLQQSSIGDLFGDLINIEKLFYRHLSDVIVESIKFFSVTKNEASQRFKFLNPELLNNVLEQNKDIVAITSHYNNWEIGSICGDSFSKFSQTALINKLSNGFLDKKLLESRQKFGLQLLPKRHLSSYLKEKKKNSAALIILGDQSPNIASKNLKTLFLGRETLVATGAERIARSNNMPVFYFKINKKKRGHYEGIIELVSDNPQSTEKNEITEKHLRILEKQILNKPEYWLWSHRRWKHNPK